MGKNLLLQIKVYFPQAAIPRRRTFGHCAGHKIAMMMMMMIIAMMMIMIMMIKAMMIMIAFCQAMSIIHCMMIRTPVGEGLKKLFF